MLFFTRPSGIANPSVVCHLSVTFIYPTQQVEIFGNVSTPFCRLRQPSADLHAKFYGDRPRRSLSSGVKCKRRSQIQILDLSKAISQTVQDTPLRTVNDQQEILPVQYHGTTQTLQGDSNKGCGPQFWDSINISDINGARKVISDAQVAVKKNSDLMQKFFSYMWLG